MSLSDKVGYVGLHHVVTDIKHANPVIKVEFIKEFLEEFMKESWTTHACPETGEDYDCHCNNNKIEDQNCIVIPKEKLKKLLGKKFVKCVKQVVEDENE